MYLTQANLKSLGQTLAQQRKNKGVTQAGLAQQAGISKRTLERLESGNSIQLIGFVRVLESLGLLVKFNTLLAGPGKPASPPSTADQTEQIRSVPQPSHTKSRSWGIDG